MGTDIFMRHKPAFIALAAMAALFGASATANGQPAPPPAAHPSPEMRAQHEARQRQHAQDLRTVLRLRADQEPALTAFLTPMPHPPMAPKGTAPLTTPQRLDRMAQRQGMITARAEAMKTFYAALSPDQRQVFDALTRLRGGHGGGGPHGMSGGAMHGGPQGHGPHSPHGD